MNDSKNHVLGIDIGGTGIKMAIVDVVTGELLTNRHKQLTPKPSTPEAVVAKIKEMMAQYFPDYQGIVGCGFPAIIKEGIATSAANVDQSWIGADVAGLVTEALGMPCYCANDADVAGLAELTVGDNSYGDGLVIFLTIGTGIGSAFFFEGQLIPNTELGHLLYKKDSYEKKVSNAVRERKGWSWEEWARRFDKYLCHVAHLFSPQGFILGGGISKNFKEFGHYFNPGVPVSPASLQNAAGVIGAAIYAHQMFYKHQEANTQQ